MTVSDHSQTNTISNVCLQAASIDIWDKKYRLKNTNGDNIDVDIEDTFKRVAKALADVESEPDRAFWEKRFFWALINGAIPAGRVLANVGALHVKPATSTINCTVSGTIEDSMHGILQKCLESGLTLKAGCGIGYEFSTLRPSGSYVSGAGAQTSGPLSFMDIFDKMCSTVSSAGGRRGAQMATFDISHPDIAEFIKAKREDGRLRQFNLSLLISREFMESVINKRDWPLCFPIKRSQLESLDVNLNSEEEVIWRDVDNIDDYVTCDSGKVACLVYNRVPAQRLWDLIMSSNYDFAEPGFILIDQVNHMNNNWFCEDIRATNPCGEQPLPPYGSCLLGSINLTQFVEEPFTSDANFNWSKFNDVVAVFTRMLDNVVELNGLALEAQRQEIMNKRRHGMGFLGLGSAMTLLGIKYGSAASLDFTEKVAKSLALMGLRTGLELAKEKGPAPIMEQVFEVTPQLLSKRPDLPTHGYQMGDMVPGKVLHAKFSRYMNMIAEVDGELIEQIAEFGCRFTHHSSIAPTGTIALSLGNNVSNGIEPSFAHRYSRNIIRPGKKSKEKVEVCSFEFLAYRALINSEATADQLPDYFISADDISPSQHIDVQAAAQKWVDSSISKTINVPTEISYESFKDIYLYAYKQGLKGCTTFRFNPEVFQGVLVRDQDLSATTYEFTLDDGEKVCFKGDEEIEYDGETHTAANLYEALKEGYYGKL